jgi:hypothetical protein
MRDPKVQELMAEAMADPESGALEEARQHLLRQLDVYRWATRSHAADLVHSKCFTVPLPKT